MIQISAVHSMLKRLKPDRSKKPVPFKYPKKNKEKVSG
jgi:hypothetical protein